MADDEEQDWLDFSWITKSLGFGGGEEEEDKAPSTSAAPAKKTRRFGFGKKGGEGAGEEGGAGAEGGASASKHGLRAKLEQKMKSKKKKAAEVAAQSKEKAASAAPGGFVGRLKAKALMSFGPAKLIKMCFPIFS